MTVKSASLSRREYLACSAATVALSGAAPPERRLRSRPNLILFVPDQLRAESLGCYGHPLVSTPNIDRCAASGVRFSHCQSPYPVCTAARCSMLTGWPPHVRGHRTVYHLLRRDEPNLFQYLKSAGYDVYWYGKNDVLTHDCFPASATAWADLAGGPEWDVKDRPWPPDHPYYYSFLFKEGNDRRAYPDYARVRAAIDVLEKRDTDRPFCIFLALFFPHPPYAAPRGFHRMYRPEQVPELRPPDLRGKPELHRAIRHSRRLDKLSERDFRTISAVYLGMIGYTDWLLGELLEALDRTGRASDTAVVLASDHGDWAGDYGLVEKWSNAMDDTLLRVPLMIRAPGGAAGHVVDDLVELHDIMPTCLELAGVEPRHTHFARSLAPQLRGAPGDPHRAVFSEGGYNTSEPHAFEPLEAFPESHIYYPKVLLENKRPELITRTSTIRTKDAKLVLRPDGESEQYDLRRDPRELHNVIHDGSYAGRREELREQLLAWHIRTSDAVPMGRDDRSMPPRRTQ